MLSCYCGFKVTSFGQWVAANCAAPPTATAGQYATSFIVNRCSLSFPVSKWRYINVGTFNLLTVTIYLINFGASKFFAQQRGRAPSQRT